MEDGMRLTGWLLVLCLAGVVDASAQDRLFVGAREVGALGHFFDDLGPSPPWLQHPRFGGERYVHIPGQGVLDLLTGSTLPLGEGWVVAYDRARPHVFVAREGGIWQEDVTNSWAVLILPRLEGLTGCVHATSADVLVCAFRRPDGRYDLLRPGGFGPVFVVTTRFGADSIDPFWLAVPDGSAIYLVDCVRLSDSLPGYCVQQDVARVDLVTGVLTRTGRYGGAFDFPGALHWDEMHERLFVLGQRIDVFSRDLVFIGSASPGGRYRAIAASPHTGRVYLAVFDDYYGFAWTTLSAYEGPSYAVVAGPRERTGSFSGSGIGLLTAPGSPRDLRSSVSGRTVSLSWTNIGAASHFVLDVGYAPGRTDMSFQVGSEPATVFNGVPPGRYYARVRGGNIYGGGRPSAEAVVVVR
jgi:hypothetical protein